MPRAGTASVVAELHRLRSLRRRPRARCACASGWQSTRRATGGRSRTDESALRERSRRLDADVLAAESRSFSAMGGDDLGDTLVRFESLRERARGLAALLAERRRGLERERGRGGRPGGDRQPRGRRGAARRRARRRRGGAARLAPDVEPLGVDRGGAGRRPAGVRGAVGRRRRRRRAGDAAEVRGELGCAARRGRARRGESGAGSRTALDVLEQKRRPARRRGRRGCGPSRRAEAVEAGLAQRSAPPRPRHVAAAEARSAGRGGRRGRRAPSGTRGGAGPTRSAHGARRGPGPGRRRPPRRSRRRDRHAARPGRRRRRVARPPSRPPPAKRWPRSWSTTSTPGRRALDAAARAATSPGAVLALGAAAAAAPPRPAGASRCVAHVRGTRRRSRRAARRAARAGVVVDGLGVRPSTWLGATRRRRRHPRRRPVRSHRLAPRRPGHGATAAALARPETRAAGQPRLTAAATTAIDAPRAAVEGAHGPRPILTRALDENDSARLSAASSARRSLSGERHDGAASSSRCVSARPSSTSGVDARRARGSRSSSALPARAEADEPARGQRPRSMAAARDRLDEHAAALGALRTDLEVRAAGFDERRAAPAPPPRRGRRAARPQRRGARRPPRPAVSTSSARSSPLDRLGGVRRRAAGASSRPSWRSFASVGAASREAAREVAGALEACAGAVRRRARARRGARADAARRDRGGGGRRCGSRPPSSRCAATSTASPTTRWPPSAPSCPRASARQLGSASSSASCGSWARSTRWRSRSSTRCRSGTQFLEAQLEDVKTHAARPRRRSSRRSTRRSSTSSPSAFADVAQNFTDLFETLFPGGKGRLRLTEPDNLLDTGIEVEAKPSGKNVRKLSLLSGGERSLTALAYLFAVFRSPPVSPFYVMDEVEAALDDVNLHRFLGLVAEFRARGPADHREPPEAHDGGRRLPLRRHDEARRLQPRHQRARHGLARAWSPRTRALVGHGCGSAVRRRPAGEALGPGLEVMALREAAGQTGGFEVLGGGRGRRGRPARGGGPARRGGGGGRRGAGRSSSVVELCQRRRRVRRSWRRRPLG